jgi:succinate dehydrogenase/fumarate reductase cytochrome b subunit
MIFGLVLHVTLLAIVGYALLFSASKAEGVVALIGRLLGVWVFLLAILSVVGAVAIHMAGGKLFGMDFSHPPHGPGHMEMWAPPGDPMPPPPPPPGHP